jgi:hypothetical protein
LPSPGRHNQQQTSWPSSSLGSDRGGVALAFSGLRPASGAPWTPEPTAGIESTIDTPVERARSGAIWPQSASRSWTAQNGPEAGSTQLNRRRVHQ